MAAEAAQVLTLNVANKSDKAKILAMLKFWLGAGSLVEVEDYDDTRRLRKFIEVKEDAIVQDIRH